MRADSLHPLRSLLLTALLAAALPLALRAQDARLTARLPTGVAGVAQRLADTASHEGLPTEPLIQKALEGESKGADSARIVRAVQALLERMRVARRALPRGTEPELVAGAAALRAGASPASLAALRALRPDRSLVVPLSVLADLIAAGITPERAWSSVRDMANTGAADAAFLALRDRLTEGRGAVEALPPESRRPPAEAPPVARPVRP